MRPRLELPLPRGYRSLEILAYHGRDPLSASERVEGATIFKPVHLAGGPVRLAIGVGDAGVAVVRADRHLDAADEAQALRVAARMLGLSIDPSAFEAALAAGSPLAQHVALRPGLRIPLTADPWEALCWAIIGQQINLVFAAALRRAMVELAGRAHGDMRVHPRPAEVAALSVEALAALRFSRAKAGYLVDAARLVASGAVDLDAIGALDAAGAEAALVALRGIGPWTARYVMLRGFGMADVAPIGDSGLAAGLQFLLGLSERPDAVAQEALMAAFRPHRSLVTAHLWAGLTSPRPSPSSAGPG